MLYTHFQKGILRAPLVLLVALGGLLWAVQAGAQTPEECLACHSDKVDGAKFTAGAHGVLGCSACHVEIKGYPHPPKVAKPDCAACHADPVAAYQKSVHGKARAQGVREAATCNDCHGNIHEVLPHTEAASSTHYTNLAAACARCHANAALAEKFHIPVARPVEAYLESVHARAVKAGKRGAVCSDCHGNHSIVPGSDPSSTLWRTNVPETCAKCHASIVKTYRESVHGEAMARGVRDAPVCTDCHGEHRILKHTEPSSPVFAANIAGETCGRCHADTRLSEKYGLAKEKVPAFQDSFHGLALRAGNLTVANCASCHGVHDIRPSRDSRSHVNEANLAKTCGKCHPGAGAHFALGPVHILPTAAGSRAVYWIRLAYLWIIGLTIGFMVLHNLLDFARKAGRPGAPRSVPEEQPERMSRPLRWQHGLVMISFPVLVYTGFALKFPESWWAAPLLVWETRFGFRGLLHRTAAVVLVASLVWHAVHLLASRRLRVCLGGLWPAYEDALHIRDTFLYYLGRRPARPHADKFSYIEKSEYWAFLWGAFIMSLTGFLLWFENLSLHYLPKWTTDVATAIHFYEAILASLAILVWHFYWVIFDPDIYPTDPSWWHGRTRAARLAERAGGESEHSSPGLQ